MRKTRKNIWEIIFVYPSFNIRFLVILIILGLGFGIAIYFLISKSNLVNNISDQISLLNLIIQIATLVLGISAAYYALRQLVETRFASLDEIALKEMQNQRYSRAIDKWKEALYIHPEASVLIDLCEAFLLIEDYTTFDRYVLMAEQKRFFKKEIFQEISDQIILVYLKCVRHLLVKNQGEAEKHLSELLTLVSKQNGLPGFKWSFRDLQTSRLYQDLSGECREITDNLISYLQKTMSIARKSEFEAKKFASQIS